MGTIFNSKVFKGVSIAGKIVKGMAKNGVVFWKTLPTDYILAYSFNGNTTDASVNGLYGEMTGTLAFDDGRKVGTQSMKFTNGCVKTILPLPVNSDKVSISFWIKTKQTGSRTVVIELSPNYDANNAFCVYLNDIIAGRIEIADHISNYNAVNSGVSVNTGSWFHILFTIDRSQNGIDQNKAYVNGSLSSVNSIYQTDHNGNFVNNILFIGQKDASTLPFVGNLQDLKIYNRVLSQDEITALYNE